MRCSHPGNLLAETLCGYMHSLHCNVCTLTCAPTTAGTLAFGPPVLFQTAEGCLPSSPGLHAACQFSAPVVAL